MIPEPGYRMGSSSPRMALTIAAERKRAAMGSTPSIAVTGSTGALGSLVAHQLSQREIAQRLLARTPSKAPDLPDAEVRQFDYADQSASAEALDGVEVLFMVSAL